MNTNQGNSIGLKSKRAKTSPQQIQFHIAAIYEQIRKMISEKDEVDLQLPSEVSTTIQRVTILKDIIQYLLEAGFSENKLRDSSAKNENIDCEDCQSYEKELQKMEAEVRNHIRTHQQLKLYQDSLEDKIEEQKNDKKQMEKKMETYKKKYEQMKNTSNEMREKIHKFEMENQKHKVETKSSRKFQRFESSNKENFGELSHRNNSKIKQRTSMEKRNHESTEKMRVSVNVRSAKGIPITNKIQAEKSKEERARILKSRLGYGC